MKCFTVPKLSLALVCEPGYQVSVERVEVLTPSAALTQIRPFIADSYREKVVVLALNSKKETLGCYVVSTGGIDHCHVRPRHVFDVAVRANAALIIVAHNHPSGDPQPSKEDIAMMHELVDLGKRLDMPLKDFLIVGAGESYWSAKNETYEL